MSTVVSPQPDSPAFPDVLKKIPVAIALLDEDRQVVFGRERLLELVGRTSPGRTDFDAPGDLVGCVNSLASEGGCGTSEACAPYETTGVQYTLLTAQDIGGEKRRRALERVFFHDITNLAGGLAGLAGVLRSVRTPQEQGQMLSAMEQSARSLISQVAAAFEFGVDATLLRRVLVNITKNALEASLPGHRVTLGAQRGGDTVTFTVHNSGVIPAEVQHQLFQRSFSTKGDGRGLGTYSVRLLTEQYLQGSVSFTSTEHDGTLFSVNLPFTVG